MRPFSIFTTLVATIVLSVSNALGAPTRELVKEKNEFSWYKLKDGNNYGAASRDGTTIIQPQYGMLFYQPSTDIFLGRCNDGSYAAHDRSGLCIIPGSRGYRSISKVESDDGTTWYMVNKNGLVGACDANGNEIIAPQFEGLNYIKGNFLYKKGTQWLPVESAELASTDSSVGSSFSSSTVTAKPAPTSASTKPAATTTTAKPAPTTASAKPTDNSTLNRAIELYNRKEWYEAYRQLLPLAGQGNAEAQYYLAKLYYERPDSWYKEDAKFRKMEYNKVVKNFDNEAKKWLKKASDSGYIEATSYLGYIYTRSQKAKERDEGNALLEYAANHGSNKARLEIARDLVRQVVVKESNVSRAISLLEQVPADYDDAQPMLLYTAYRLQGQYIYKNDPNKQNESYRKALAVLDAGIAAGHEGCTETMGSVYEYGTCGVEKNPETAVEWYSRSGTGYSKKRMEALKPEIEQRQVQRDIASLNPTQLYNKGYTFYKDQKYDLAFRYFKAAAENGHPMAQNMTGYMYEHALGVPVDFKQALHWYEKSAAQGDANAMNNLGVMYHNGNGVAKDYATASAWYKKAIAKGNSQAKDNQALIDAHYKKKAKEEAEAKARAQNKTTAKSNGSGQAASGRSTDKRYYSTWSMNPAVAAFNVHEEDGGYTPVFHITDNVITIDGKYGYNNDNYYTYSHTTDQGNHVYVLEDKKGAPLLHMKWEIIVAPDRCSLNMVFYINSQLTTITNFVDTPQLRKKVIAANRGNNSAPNYNLLPGYNGGSGSSGGSDNNQLDLRYPEYQRYNDRNGRFDNQKYNRITRAECKACNGTGISPYKESTAGSHSAYHNNRGDKCPYCGSYDFHFHNRCPSCSAH